MAEIVTILALVAAVFIAKHNLFLGALVAMFPTKLVGFALTAPGNKVASAEALLVGSASTFICAAVYLAAVRAELNVYISVGLAVAAWLACAAAGRLIVSG